MYFIVVRASERPSDSVGSPSRHPSRPSRLVPVAEGMESTRLNVELLEQCVELALPDEVRISGRSIARCKDVSGTGDLVAGGGFEPPTFGL